MRGKFMFTVSTKKLLLAAFVAVFCACSNDTESDEEVSKVRHNTKIDDYLYGVEYDDYDFDACKAYFDKQYIPANAACSEVRRGNFVGRNLDWYINKNASAIIKVNKTKEHYASIGIVGCFPQFSNDIAKSGEYNEVYKYLPFKTEDGINEHGLYVGVNVMPTGETSFDTASWKPHQFGLGAAHTNPSAKETYATNYLPRILLDRAKNIEEAKAIIDSIDWVEPEDYPHEGETQSFHWMICDKNSSVVLEFMDNKAHYTETTDLKEPGFATIMTNFTNSLMEKGIMQINGVGYERFDVIKKNYTDYKKYPDSFEGMQKLMAEVWFSKAYTQPIDSKDLWLTEFAYDDLPASSLYKNFDVLEIPELKEELQGIIEGFKNEVGWFTDECEYWFTTHTSVYNIEDRKLHVLVHEGLSGMKNYYEASLNSHFEKPLN